MEVLVGLEGCVSVSALLQRHSPDLNFLKCLFLRERERTSRGGAEREGDTESEAGSRL